MKAKKLGISVGILKDPESFHEAKGNTQYYQGLSDLEEEAKVVEVMVDPVEVLNRLDHPVTLSYNGLSMIVPPRGKSLIADSAKLGACPKGIFVIPKPELKVK